MAKQPVVYRVEDLVPSTRVQSAELRPEQLEQIPFALGQSQTVSDTNWPPAGFTGVTMTTPPAAVNKVELLPQPFDLAWVQGDSPQFQWLFTDVLWTDVDPGITDPTAPVWVNTTWASQVRNPYIYSTYAADFWVPAYGYQYNWWRGNSIVAAFVCTADVIEMPGVEPTQWATRVTMDLSAVNSAKILPGNWFRWDLQTRTVDNDVRTRLRGKVRVITEWTVA